MRVTEVTKRDHVVDNIQRSSGKLQDIQMQMASGRRLNKTSDDPIGAARSQDIVTTISSQNQLLQNIEDNVAWLQRSEQEITHINEILGKIRTLALSQAGSDSNEESRQMVAREFSAARKSLFDAGNAREGKLYVFSGIKSLTPALKKNGIFQPAKVLKDAVTQSDIRDLLDVSQFRAQFEGYSNNDYRIRVTRGGVWGQARVKISDDGGRTWSKEQTLRPVTHVVNPEGKPNDQVLLKFSDQEGRLGNVLPKQFDFNSAASASFDKHELGILFPQGIEFVFQPNPEVTYNGSIHKKEALISNGLSIPVNITAQELLLGHGENGVDTFSLLAAMERALLENDGTAIAQRLGELDLAQTQVLKQQADVGNIIRELYATQSKLENLQFEKESQLSDIQDLDIAEATVDLKVAEANNKLALNTGARLIQPSLSDFLR
ncbi:MAG: Flagellar filament 30.7 kDa core protein [Deltaproteobacteria bacterium]|jgi:flagellar hook-associated protein 3 FlgL|nr:Flagellar filament 30.7 kDa core protein [Deltaproteobacteria bacterium]